MWFYILVILEKVTKHALLSHVHIFERILGLCQQSDMTAWGFNILLLGGIIHISGEGRMLPL